MDIKAFLIDNKEFLINFVIICAKMALIIGPILGVVPFIVLAERKLAGWIQQRPGPNRVGPWGLLQGLVDGGKIFMKEDILPNMVDKPLFFLAPLLALAPALICLSVIPFGPTFQLPDNIPFVGQFIDGREISLSITDIPVSLIFVFAVSAIGVYGIVLAGWSSNSKYSLLGGIRSAAQLISYDIGLVLSVGGVVILASSLDLRTIAVSQGGGFWNWYVFKQPLAFILFMLCILAETNRLPFDLPEGESELTGGFHTEYSSMKFAMFFMGEYVAIVVMCALGVTLFFGGWHGPIDLNLFKDIYPINTWWFPIIWGGLWFTVKISAFIAFFIYLRFTWPRFRFDQLLALGWKVILPAGLINIFMTALLAIFKAPMPAYFINGLLIIFIFDFFYSRKRKKDLEGYLKLSQ